MRYKLELWCAGVRWEQSLSYPGEYTLAEVDVILAEKFNQKYTWRIVPLSEPVRVPKPYRRHAAASYLELRGAQTMLMSARRRIVREVGSSLEGVWAVEAFHILTTAMLAIDRQLETL